MPTFYLLSLLVCLHATSTFSGHALWEISEAVPEYSTRRRLDMEQCATGNLIDHCSRCGPEWESNRKKLVDCTIGFSKDAIGGRDGEIYVVTNSDDGDLLSPTPGTLRHAAIQAEPLWIIFDHDMGMQWCGTHYPIHDNQWIRRRCNLDIQLKGCLDRSLHTRKVLRRAYRLNIRHGYFHIVNNVYVGWEMYAIGGGANPTINSQGNVFIASDNSYAKEASFSNPNVTKRESSFDDWKSWNWRSEGDMMVKESYIRASGMVARPTSLVTKTAQYAGTLSCRKDYGC
ncbi:putative pectate lyase 21 [Hibiscus syriacus]|uniref:Pectate lyase n=1 Tax=Hibiscus syriacus TaxID=106335 RepID=A0A6A3BCD3_HIBSY|nr:putative pectate lyase 21 [Hibiscus syriacus]